ncbi:hypothetical protein Vretimale_9528 [Volvox reticuliferus]|uniref:thiamine diphosphokinase n=1 Tax=Volvox reticuliferus TaxID=1737510 RepID=A0A8J4CWJ5_9CHLO|nr:hypothetical protein Vretifemale_18809 [Volvox reticuliferus]GIM05111.1 hypothetical protein Vretimale_9528 [Volvox reticuliferus]
MRSLSGFSLVCQRFSVIAVPLKPKQHWATSRIHTASIINPCPTRRRPGLAGIAEAAGLGMSVNHVPAVETVGLCGGISVPDAASSHGAAAAAPFATQAQTSDAGTLGGPYDQYIKSDFLGPEPLPAGRKVYIIVLNYCLPVGLLHAWPLASVRICADGGCNRLYDELPFMMPPTPEGIAALEALAEDGTNANLSMSPVKDKDKEITALLRLVHMPDVVLGDLDSLSSDVRQYYVQHGVPFEDMSYDQDTNDLAKAISMVEERYIKSDPDPSPNRHQILVLGALGGRLDHTLANLNVLHVFPHLNITLWGDGNLVRLVRPGKALITPDERFEGPTCGLIPIAGPVIATSSGLKWNVSATQLRVGGLVSSSNLLTGSPVEVACDGPLLWSTEIREEPRPDLRSLWERIVVAAAAARKQEEREGAGR